MKNNRTRPNILFIITDQQRYDSMGCTGNPYAVTPNLDALAREGTVFDRCISNSAICSPSRACLLTGLQQSTHGLWTNGVALPRGEDVPLTEGSQNAFPGKWIASDIPTFADVFRDAGYRTASVGKLHLAPVAAHASLGYKEAHSTWAENFDRMADWHGPYYGFADVDLTIGHGEKIDGHYRAWLKREHPEVLDTMDKAAASRALEFPTEPMLYPSTIPAALHNSSWIGNTACGKIRQYTEDDKPFLMWVGFPDPHSPFVPPEELAREFETHDTLSSRVPVGASADKPFAIRHLQEKRNAAERSPAMIKRAQQYTDAMMHLIDINIGKLIDTLKATGAWENTVIVYTSDHGDFLGDFGMHGKCVPCCKALNHVPLLLRAPGANLPARVAQTASGVDLLPTLCDLADIAPPALVHGESLLEVSTDGRRHGALVQHFTPTPDRTNLSVYDNRYRLTWYTRTDEFELYDHEDDPYELVNRADDPTLAAERARLLDMLKTETTRTVLPRAGRVAVW